MRPSILAVLVSFAASTAWAEKPSTQHATPIRIGIIGLDTSHVQAFTSLIQGPKVMPELKNLRVVAAYPGGSADLPQSIDRVAGFTADLEGMGVEIVGSIDELLPKVDVVMLESVDGRPHLAQVRPVIAAKKPLFIDKPVAASLADGMEIFRLAKEAGVPCFSSSRTRFSPSTREMLNNKSIGDIVGCVAYSPCTLEEHHGDLYWYGIHGVEMLYTIMGPGCVSVTRSSTSDAEVVTGVWKGGRLGTFCGQRKAKADFGALVFGTKGTGVTGPRGDYVPLLLAIQQFFETGKAPVEAETTLEILAFMDAADESKRQGGVPVTLESMVQRARGSKSP